MLFKVTEKLALTLPKRKTYISIRRWIRSSAARFNEGGSDLQGDHRALVAPRKGDRVVVAMSGGVDSSVTARLLVDQDYDLSAVFMRNWDTRDESGTDKGCEWEKDWEDVQRVCKMIDLPCEMIDLSRDYWNRVFQPSLRAWEVGETPNPDVWCNREVKFGILLDRLMDNTKPRWLATGHYGGVEWDTSHAIPRPKLLRADDRTKDQSYYLSGIRESSLRKTLFPLHHIPKSEVFEMAKSFRLPTATREESMGICFVGEKRHFKYISPKPGPIVDETSGRQVGAHQGLWNFTIGQKARIRGMAEKQFVSNKDTRSNTLYVVPGSSHPKLLCDGLEVKYFNWIWKDHPPRGLDSPEGFAAQVQFRYRHLPVPCFVKQISDSLVIKFAEPQHAIALGQIAAIYDGTWCLGSGAITGRIRHTA